ncbi:NifB/NifX family molybdenum-iron cluster-binding protein [Planctomycetota bacterium]
MASNRDGLAGERGILRIAVPCFGEEVAPSFDVARHVRLWEIEDGCVSTCRELTVDGPNGVERLRLMRRARVDVIICNGIQASLRQMLEAAGCQVIDGVFGLASEALFGFLAGRLTPRRTGEVVALKAPGDSPASLVDWTHDLLAQHNWSVRRVTEPSFYPVDLTATTQCPCCHRPVRIAVCCGAHAYCVSDEIRDFHRVTAGRYDARIYVYHALLDVVRVCNDYRVNLLDPAGFAASPEADAGQLFPVIEWVSGHDLLARASVTQRVRSEDGESA